MPWSRLMQLVAAPTRPTALPPMVSVTVFVAAPSASSCGGTGPVSVDCGAYMSAVVAPEQGTSTSGTPGCFAATRGEAARDRRQPGDERSGGRISGPAAAESPSATYSPAVLASAVPA